MKKIAAILCAGLAATASASAPASTDSGAEAVGPANVKLQFHAPAQYPVQQPFYGYPWGYGYGAQGFGYGGYPFAHPLASHPGFQPFLGPHPAAYAPFAAPYFGGFAAESETISDNHHVSDAHDEETASAPEASNPWAAAQANWGNYFSGPTSEFQWPGAEEARPGVHPTLGGTLNPWSPLGAPTHPYPFPMHQGLKNGPEHPRPFTLMGQYYPGTTGLPFAPQFAPTYNPWGFASQPTYFPASQNGDMSEHN